MQNKGFFKLPNMHMLIKQKNPLLSRNLALETFGKLLTVLSAKVNLLYLLYPATQRCCLLHLKQNCLLKTFLTLILMTLVKTSAFPSRTNLNSMTPKMVKKVIMNLDLSKELLDGDKVRKSILRN